jgi:hypothetical protein
MDQITIFEINLPKSLLPAITIKATNRCQIISHQGFFLFLMAIE